MVLKTNMKWRLFMNQTLLIWLYAVALAAVYLFVALAVSIFSRLSLRKNPKSSISEQVIEIDTETDLYNLDRLAVDLEVLCKGGDELVYHILDR